MSYIGQAGTGGTGGYPGSAGTPGTPGNPGTPGRPGTPGKYIFLIINTHLFLIMPGFKFKQIFISFD